MANITTITTSIMRTRRMLMGTLKGKVLPLQMAQQTHHMVQLLVGHMITTKDTKTRLTPNTMIIRTQPSQPTTRQL